VTPGRKLKKNVSAERAPRVVERVQTGVRIEKNLLKVLKAVAEYHELSLGDLLEGIVLHAFDGRAAFEPKGLERIREFKRLYGLTLGASDSHRLVDAEDSSRAPRGAPRGRR
jgi:hypothetical protein